jgi:hypothetical protein
MSSSQGNHTSIQGKSLEEQASVLYKTANNTFDQIPQPSSNEIEKLKAKLNTMYSQFSSGKMGGQTNGLALELF